MLSELLHSPWAAALGASLATGLGGVLVAGLSLRLPDRLLKKALPLSLSFATGALLGAVFLDLLPELTEALPHHRGFLAVLVGILLLHLVERTWMGHQDSSHAGSIQPGTRAIVMLGDGLHNLVDGLALAAAFSTSPAAGLAVTVAIFVHEVPHELANFALLLESGLSRRQALCLNALFSLPSLIGAAGGMVALGHFEHLAPYALALSAASFLYITLADLIPGHRKPVSHRRFAAQILLILLGVLLVGGVGHPA
nr:ZIP family metal transporter [uncultured Holophaga sp.]